MVVGSWYVSGDFLPAPQPLQKDEKGIWTATVGPIKPELYAFQVSVNGVAASRVALLWVGCGTEDTLFESVKQFAG